MLNKVSPFVANKDKTFMHVVTLKGLKITPSPLSFYIVSTTFEEKLRLRPSLHLFQTVKKFIYCPVPEKNCKTIKGTLLHIISMMFMLCLETEMSACANRPCCRVKTLEKKNYCYLMDSER